MTRYLCRALDIWLLTRDHVDSHGVLTITLRWLEQEISSEQQLMGMLSGGSGGGDGLSIVVPAALEPLVASQHTHDGGQLSPVVALHGFSDTPQAHQLLQPATQVLWRSLPLPVLLAVSEVFVLGAHLSTLSVLP